MINVTDDDGIYLFTGKPRRICLLRALAPALGKIKMRLSA
jgi:hypothetical protein